MFTLMGLILLGLGGYGVLRWIGQAVDRGDDGQIALLRRQVQSLELRLQELPKLHERLRRLEEQAGIKAEPETVLPTPPPLPTPSAPPPAVPPPEPLRPSAPTPLRPSAPAPLRPSAPAPSPSRPLAHSPARPAFDWESFLGVKLFAWLGGFALFLAAIFLMKYSIDHDLVSPLLRVLIAAAVGAGCVAGGLLIRRRDLAMTAQTLCAAGVSVLYADVYAARTLYDFVPPAVAFWMMTLLTGMALVLAERLNSRFVAILGWAGGFLTPPLLSTGEDRTLALFVYIALLNSGIALLSYRRRWGFLLSLGAAATLATEAGWTAQFLHAHLSLGMAIYGGFALFFAAASELHRRAGRDDLWSQAPAALVPMVSVGFVAHLFQLPIIQREPVPALALLLALTGMSFYAAARHREPLVAMLGAVGAFALPLMLALQTTRPLVLLGYVAIADVLVLYLATRVGWSTIPTLAAFGTLAMEAVWASHSLRAENALFAMGVLLGFAALFAAAAELAKAWNDKDQSLSAPAIFVPIASIAFAGAFFLLPDLQADPRWSLGLLGGMLLVSLYSTVRSKSVAAATAAACAIYVWPIYNRVPLPDVWLLGFGLSVATALTLTGLFTRWSALISVSAIGTLALEVLWLGRAALPEQAVAVALLAAATGLFFLAARELAARRGMNETLAQAPASIVPLVAMAAVSRLLAEPALSQRPGVVLGLLLFLGMQLAYLAVRREASRPVYAVGGLVSFALLAAWTHYHLRPHNLYWGLGSFLLFTALHTVFPFWLQWKRASATPFTGSVLAPLFGMALVMLAISNLGASGAIWLVLCVMGLLALGAAFLAGTVVAAAVAYFLTIGCFVLALFSSGAAMAPTSLLVTLGLFCSGFFAWGLWISAAGTSPALKRPFSTDWDLDGEHRPHFAAATALMPFVLLSAVSAKMPLTDSTAIFSVMGVLVAMLLGLARWRGVEKAPLAALFCSSGVQAVWAVAQPTAGGLVTGPWALGFYVAFSLFPFLYASSWRGTAVWVSSAAAGLIYFPLLHHAFIALWGQSAIGLLPALLAVPPLLGFVRLHHTLAPGDDRRPALLAWFGGVALFFTTLIFPLQFDKEVLTLAWALEGAALLWLATRVPYGGLRAVGASLLLTAFVRLALNPAVLDYHPRTGIPLWNWYLVVYGLTALSCFAGAKALLRVRALAGGQGQAPGDLKTAGMLNALGAILLFLLLNIQIADYFSEGTAITFHFSGNLAQDMTYSIGWGLFAIGLLVAGILSHSRFSRYASLALLVVTILKVFLHDLWRLGGLFRVGSFAGLAIGLMLVSFLYQRFLSEEKSRG